MASNLDSGPWLSFKEERRQQQKLKEERRHRYWKFQRGWDAFNRGEPIFAPHWWPDEDRALFHEGWEAAQRLARDFRNRA